MVRQQRNIVGTLAQRRKLNGNDIQAVIKILAKLSLGDGFSQVLIGCGEHAHVHRQPFLTTDAADLMLLKDAQQARLHVRADTADLIEKAGSALGFFEHAFFIRNRAGT